MKRLRYVPAFGVPGSVLFAAAGLVLTLALLLVAAGVAVADDVGTRLHDIAEDAAQAGQAAFNAQELVTDQGYSGSGYLNPSAYVVNAVNGLVQADTTGLSILKLNTPVVTISGNGQVQVTLTGDFVDTVLSHAFATFLPSNPTATFPIHVIAQGQLG